AARECGYRLGEAEEGGQRRVGPERAAEEVRKGRDGAARPRGDGLSGRRSEGLSSGRAEGLDTQPERRPRKLRIGAVGSGVPPAEALRALDGVEVLVPEETGARRGGDGEVVPPGDVQRKPRQGVVLRGGESVARHVGEQLDTDVDLV